MRGVLKFVVVAVVLASAAVAVMYVALPGNQAATDGPADPILTLRRPALRALRWAGFAPSGGGFFFWFDAWLPSGYCSEWQEPMADGSRRTTARLSRSAEPVYRGLFWPVGDRITIRVEEFEEPEADVRLLRLGYVRDGRVLTSGEVRFDAGALDRQVSGFVPRDADGWFAVEIDGRGGIHGVCSHGTAEMDRILASRRESAR
jgi:hypothetical protein